jgi:hypothetical protein
MPRKGSHGGATLRETAATVVKLEIVLELLAEIGNGDALAACLRRAAFTAYCERLCKYRPGETPPDDPPPME